ncbi:MAG: SUMF1/EgtB/PvdO family nonheme iron enzyme, partial [Kiritimatiellia bacterium]|nr:SUMF1/EgtB/PvdO family nonheme iron enzyme [Kiritimatiellia bacterium]
VTFSPQAAQEYGGSITVHSDATTGGDTHPISGTGFEPVRILTLGGDLGFGEVVIGYPSTRLFTIATEGNMPLTVTGIDFPPGFSGSWAEGTIAAGSNRVITVTFSPQVVQDYGGEITVHSDATAGTNTHSISGTGTEAGTDDIFLIIDLSAGPEAESYPVSALSTPPAGGWTDDYLTEKLVLRWIPAGTFIIGSPTDELGRSSNETQRQVTLTKDYYIGVFQVTQKQWERVMGDWPSYFTNAIYRDTRPLEQRSWNDIRGGAWPGEPSGSGQPDSGTFLQRIRARTGLSFDLPTEAQWEYACRAGTLTALNSGENLTATESCPNLSALGRYSYNHPGGYVANSTVSTDGGTAKVGSYLPNAWGLYDMHGNVQEWCLDWYAAAAPGEMDPVGAASGFRRVRRGGSLGAGAGICRSAYRFCNTPSFRSYLNGFRLSRTLP